MIRTAKLIDGKMVYDPPYTPEEEAAQAARFADMCQSRIPPGAFATERALMQGRIQNGGVESMHPTVRDMYIKKARAAGVSPQGKTYCSQLARFAGDPQAWCASQSDVVDIAKKRNLTIKACNVKGVKKDEKPNNRRLSDRAIKDLARNYVQENPDLGRKPRELVEMIVDKHGAKKVDD